MCAFCVGSLDLQLVTGCSCSSCFGLLPVYRPLCGVWFGMFVLVVTGLLQHAAQMLEDMAGTAISLCWLHWEGGGQCIVLARSLRIHMGGHLPS